jgi:hypothetical protein
MDFANGKLHAERMIDALAVFEAFISEQLAVSSEQTLGAELLLA